MSFGKHLPLLDLFSSDGWTLERPVEPCRVVAFSSAQREKGLKYLLYVSLNWNKLHTLNCNGFTMGFSRIWLFAWNVRTSSNFKRRRMLLFCIFVTVGSTTFPFSPPTFLICPRLFLWSSFTCFYSFILLGLAGLRSSLLLSGLFMLLGAALRSVPLADLKLKRW